MHILFVGHEARANGASRSMIDLIDELSDKCEFSVVLPYESGPTVDALKARNVNLYYVPFRRWAYEKNTKYYLKCILWRLKWDNTNQKLAEEFANLIRKESIDIIHSNSSVIDFGFRLSLCLNKPHVWHIREFGELDFNICPLVSYKQYFDTFNDERNHVCCISHSVTKKFENKIPKADLSVIYNGVGKEHINLDKEYKITDNLICLQSGYINEAKGQRTSILAIQELYRRGIKNVELLLAGRGGVDRFGMDINKLHGVKELGVVTDLPMVRKEVDIEIVASRAEAFGRVTVEAMMSGIPVIGSDSGGTSEIIKDGENGYLFAPGDYNALADKIEYLYYNREEIRRMGKKAQAYAVDNYSINRCANEVYALYEKVAGEDI